MQQYNKDLHFLLTSKSDLNSSYFFETLSNFSVSLLSRYAISQNFTSSFISCSFLKYSFLNSCRNHFCKDIKRFQKIVKELRAKNNFKDGDNRKRNAYCLSVIRESLCEGLLEHLPPNSLGNTPESKRD